MEESKSIILPNKEYANATSRDLDYNVELQSSQNLMRLGDRDIILNLNDLFDFTPNKLPDIIVISFQELVKLSAKNVVAN